jgi:exopolysaccharide production protein ExoY
MSSKSTALGTSFLPGKTEIKKRSPVQVKSKTKAAGLRRAAIRVMDIAFCLIALLFLMPILIVVCIAIKISDGGPILFRQSRVGKAGAEFVCYKFRSMVLNSNEVLIEHLDRNLAARDEWEIYRKLKKDPRITILGRFIRKTSIDELPQILNVLRGDMSLVGPRPIMRDEIKNYGRYFVHYTSVLPGITGLWQVNGRNNTTYSRRVALDTVYSKNQTISLYFMIILKTVPAILLQKGSY